MRNHGVNVPVVRMNKSEVSRFRKYRVGFEKSDEFRIPLNSDDSANEPNSLKNCPCMPSAVYCRVYENLSGFWVKNFENLLEKNRTMNFKIFNFQFSNNYLMIQFSIRKARKLLKTVN